MGADVVKVESPSGDETRAWGPPFAANGQSAYFISANRNKRSIVLDLKKDQETLRRLIAKCDILVENFLPKSVGAFGLTPHEIHAINPRVIVCSISAYGRSSRKADQPGYDFVLQAVTGFMATTGEKHGPSVKTAVAIVDVLTAQQAVSGILAALYRRERSGQGCVLDIALADCGFAAQVNLAQAWLVSGTLPARQGNSHLQIVPYQSFAAEDDWLVLAIGNDRQWTAFCKAAEADFAGKPEWATNQSRVEQRDEVVSAVASLIARRTVAVWEQLLRKVGVPCGRVGTYATFAQQAEDQGRAVTTKIKDGEGRVVELIQSPLVRDRDFRVPPQLGEHQREVFADWDVNWSE